MWTHCKDPVPGLEDGLVLVGRVVLSHQVDTLVLEGVGNWGGGQAQVRPAPQVRGQSLKVPPVLVDTATRRQ